MDDLLLAPPTGEETEEPFAQARREHPGCKYIRTVHPAGFEFVMVVPPASAWFELLPDQQTVEIVLKTQ